MDREDSLRPAIQILTSTNMELQEATLEEISELDTSYILIRQHGNTKIRKNNAMVKGDEGDEGDIQFMSEG